jgi:Ni/Fe-hydrogenase subunit HybB-like protein
VVGVSDDATGASDAAVDVNAVVTYLQWGGIAALALLAAVAGVGVYTSVGAVIDVWVADRYRPLARAAFNAAVLCVALAGMFPLLRRVRG